MAKQGKNKVSKPRKPPTLKQKLKKESKVVKAKDLQWKLVDIPDNLGDYEGFYGLEEIDGVDVQIVNGKAEFIVRDNGKVENKSKKEETNENGENNMDVEDNETPEVEDEKPTEQEEEEEEEFAGFEDDENNQEDANTSERVSNNDKDDKLAESNDELNAVSFANLDLPLPDDKLTKLARRRFGIIY